MLFVIVGMAFFFLLIGLMLTERNAPYLLSGYNMLSADEQRKVDIKSYIIAFRKFHVGLALSFVIIGIVLIYAVSEVAGGIFLGVYPILAYIYFIVISRKYFSHAGSRWSLVCVAILGATLVFVSGVFYVGLKESKLRVHTDAVTLTGIYGEDLKSTDIESVELVRQLPYISTKSNGFAIGHTRKGYFTTKDGTTVKLILNQEQPLYILLTKSNHSKVYFSAKSDSNEQIFRAMESALPGVEFKHHP